MDLYLSIFISSFMYNCPGIASAPLSGLIGKYGYDALHGKCHILNCNHLTMFGFDLPAGGITLSLGVGLPCIIVIIFCLIIFKRYGCCMTTRHSDEEEQPREVQCLTTVLVFCYLIFILPIYIIEWIPYNADSSPLAQILVYTWYWLIYIINVFVYILISPRLKFHIRLK